MFHSSKVIVVLTLLSSSRPSACSPSSLPSPTSSSSTSSSASSSSSTVGSAFVSASTSSLSAPLAYSEASDDVSCVSKVSHCAPVSNLTCLGRPLDHTFVSFHFTGLQYIWEAQSRLRQWTALRHVPECWTVLEPLLCSVYLPPCNPNTSTVDKVWSQWCTVTQGPCHVAMELLSDGWPDFLTCSNSLVFGPACQDPSRKPASRPRPTPAIEPACLQPLVPTTNPHAAFPGVSGCGLRCNFTGLAVESERSAHSVLFVVVGAGAVAFLGATLTLCMARKWRKVLDEHIDFWLTLLWTPVCVALLLPRLFSHLEVASVCEEDHTLVLPHANSDKGFWCFVTLVVPYGCLVQINGWFLFWSYASFHICHSGSREDKTKIDLNSKTPRFMALSLVCTVVLSLSPWWPLDAVSGDALTQTCVLSSSTWVRMVFVMLPLLLTHLVAGYFNLRTILVIRKVFNTANVESNNSVKVVKKKRQVKPGLHSILFIVAHHMAAIIVMVDEVSWQIWGWSWSTSVSSYVWCRIGQSGLIDPESVLSQCTEPHHTLTMVSVHTKLLAWSMPALITLWPRFNRTSVHIWQHFVTRLCMPLPDEHLEAHNEHTQRRCERTKYKLNELQRRVNEARREGRRSVSLPSISQALDTGSCIEDNFVEQGENVVQLRSLRASSEVGSVGRGKNAFLETLSVAGFSRQGSFMSMMSMTPSERLEFHLFSQKSAKRSKKHFFGRNKRHKTKRMSGRGSSSSLNVSSLNSSFSDHFFRTHGHLANKTTRSVEVQTSPLSAENCVETRCRGVQCEILSELKSSSGATTPKMTPQVMLQSCNTALTTLTSSSSSSTASVLSNNTKVRAVLEPNVIRISIPVSESTSSEPHSDLVANSNDTFKDKDLENKTRALNKTRARRSAIVDTNVAY